MSSATAPRWRTFDEATPVLTCEYSFGPATANALAVRSSRGMVVISPPYRAGEQAFEEIRRCGDVVALVAPNAFHYMGIAEWKRRFPDAGLFAPAQSIPRVARKTGLAGFRPVSEWTASSDTHLLLYDMPHYKTGELLVQIETAKGRTWYLTDVVLNLPALPEHPVARVIFRVADCAPGVKLNNIAPLFMVRDKAALKRWLSARLDAEAPHWLIPAHGDVVELGRDLEPLRRQFASRRPH